MSGSFGVPQRPPMVVTRMNSVTAQLNSVTTQLEGQRSDSEASPASPAPYSREDLGGAAPTRAPVLPSIRLLPGSFHGSEAGSAAATTPRSPTVSAPLVYAQGSTGSPSASAALLLAGGSGSGFNFGSAAAAAAARGFQERGSTRSSCGGMMPTIGVVGGGGSGAGGSGVGGGGFDERSSDRSSAPLPPQYSAGYAQYQLMSASNAGGGYPSGGYAGQRGSVGSSVAPMYGGGGGNPMYASNISGLVSTGARLVAPEHESKRAVGTPDYLVGGGKQRDRGLWGLHILGPSRDGVQCERLVDVYCLYCL